FLLSSLALIAVALGAPTDGPESTPTTAAPDAKALLRELLVSHNATEEAIAEFFDAHIDVIPFTPESFEAYKNWTAKWNIELPEHEQEANAVLEDNVEMEAARRAAEMIIRLTERVRYLEEFAKEGGMSQESLQKYKEIDSTASKIELELVAFMTEELKYKVMKDWGIKVREAANEQEPEEKSVDDENEGEEATTTEEVETTTIEEEEDVKEEKEGAKGEEN
ncbi:hypothetical protein PMAYCL1PPCAC_07981, partial [Pristionchus mayeri]